MGVCIFGAGGHAKDLVGQMIADLGRAAIVCLVDEFNPGGFLLDVPIRTFDAALASGGSQSWLVAIGDPQQRRAVSDRLLAHNLAEGTFVSSGTYVAPGVGLGPGTQVFAGSRISVDAHVGRGVIINFNCSISHDVSIGDFATLSPNCSVAGRVSIEEGAFLGVGAVVINGTIDRPLTIGRRAVVGAGAVVTSSIDANETVVGVPARPLRKS